MVPCQRSVSVMSTWTTRCTLSIKFQTHTRLATTSIRCADHVNASMEWCHRKSRALRVRLSATTALPTASHDRAAVDLSVARDKASTSASLSCTWRHAERTRYDAAAVVQTMRDCRMGIGLGKQFVRRLQLRWPMSTAGTGVSGPMNAACHFSDRGTALHVAFQDVLQENGEGLSRSIKRRQQKPPDGDDLGCRLITRDAAVCRKWAYKRRKSRRSDGSRWRRDECGRNGRMAVQHETSK